MKKLSKAAVGAVLAFAVVLVGPASVGTPSVVVAEGGPWCC